MIAIKRTDSTDETFHELVGALDKELAIRDGDEHVFYAQLNKTDHIRHVVVAYDGDVPVGCGAIRFYATNTMEVKRMFISLDKRGRGIASTVLGELEKWCRELGFAKCILETGKNQPEALRLYEKNGYRIIPNYGAYENVANSVCFEKTLTQ